MDSPATTLIPCAFCRGKGVASRPDVSAHCEVCLGRGTNTVPWPHVDCAFCEGSGSFRTFSCLVCRGTGVVPPLAGPTRRCDDCRGRAFDHRTGLPCLRCRGRGLVACEAHALEPAVAGPFLEATHAEVCVAF
jgi:DnaJ-class molecular chaperone